MIHVDVVQILEPADHLAALLLLDPDFIELLLRATDGVGLDADGKRLGLDGVTHVALAIPAAPRADMADDDIARFDVQRAAFDTNAFARRGLSGDGDIRLRNG